MTKPSEDILEIFASAPPTTEEDIEQLRRVAHEIQNDPQFLKELIEDIQKEKKLKELEIKS